MRLICGVGAFAIVFAGLVSLVPKHVGGMLAEYEQAVAERGERDTLESEVTKGRLIKRVRSDGRVEYAARIDL